MWKLIIFLACIGIAKANFTEYFSTLFVEEWKAFKLEHKKNYTDPIVENFRLQIFMENREKIAKHNQLYSQGLVSYKLDVNEFSDMLTAEFLYKYCGAQPPNLMDLNSTIPVVDYMIPANVELPDHVDWRGSGAVTHVKNQGPCGSCWAFSTTGSLESQVFRRTGRLISLSEQNLVDCSKGYGNNGCHGGFMDRAFFYIIRNGGVDTEQSYPYNARDNNPCRFNRNTIGATAKAVARVRPGDEGALMWAVATVGPMSVAIQATQSFMHYRGGVYFEPHCDPNKINHAVLIVGYGTDPHGGAYWLVKNSWGGGWGEGGYIKMARNRNNNCGIASWAFFPQL